MTAIVRYDTRGAVLVKGAPEILLERCTSYLAADGSTRPWTPELKSALLTALKDAAGQATGSWNPDGQKWFAEAALKLVKGKTIIYVCRNRTCKLPVQEVNKALELFK